METHEEGYERNILSCGRLHTVTRTELAPPKQLIVVARHAEGIPNSPEFVVICMA